MPVSFRSQAPGPKITSASASSIRRLERRAPGKQRAGRAEQVAPVPPPAPAQQFLELRGAEPFTDPIRERRRLGRHVRAATRRQLVFPPRAGLKADRHRSLPPLKSRGVLRRRDAGPLIQFRQLHQQRLQFGEVHVLGQLPLAVAKFEDGRLPQLFESPPSARSLAPISPALDDLISRCLERDPAKRPASMTVVSRALRGEVVERVTEDLGAAPTTVTPATGARLPLRNMRNGYAPYVVASTPSSNAASVHSGRIVDGGGVSFGL